jgi:hypothetical protein
MNQKRTGRYHYTCDGVMVATEAWSIETAIDGSTLIRSSRDASQFGAHFHVEGRISTSGESLYDFAFRRSADGPVLRIAHYLVDAMGKIAFNTEKAIETSSEAIFFPLMRIFTGRAIIASVKAGGEATWVVPQIATPTKLESLFEPDLSVRHVEVVAGLENCYLLAGGPYAEKARIKLFPDGLLETYQFTPIGTKQVWTCSYASSSA